MQKFEEQIAIIVLQDSYEGVTLKKMQFFKLCWLVISYPLLSSFIVLIEKLTSDSSEINRNQFVFTILRLILNQTKFRSGQN